MPETELLGPPLSCAVVSNGLSIQSLFLLRVAVLAAQTCRSAVLCSRLAAPLSEHLQRRVNE